MGLERLELNGWDDIIVGAGSSGAVLASRLSEQSWRRVLLIEAGPDYTDVDTMPAALKSGAAPIHDGFNWTLGATIGTTSRWRDFLRSARTPAANRGSLPPADGPFPYPIGKVTGGTSAVNAAIAMRGIPDDFAQWVRDGNTEWAWDRVLPYYKKIETDQDFGGEAHGSTGPIPITRWEMEDLSTVQRAFLTVCAESGLPEIEDFNYNDGPGVGRLPVNIRDQVRVSTAIAYLDAARRRPNLTVLCGSTVQRVLFEGRRAVGVEVCDGDGERAIFGSRITLCAGAIHSPVILQRSGVGNAHLTRALGIALVVDLPGVGENLNEHPYLAIWSGPPPGVCELRRSSCPVTARVATRPGEPYDLQLLHLTRNKDLGKGAVNEPLCDLLHVPVVTGIAIILMQPNSRGRVFVDSLAPGRNPVVELNFCSDPRDLDSLVRGLRAAWKMVHSPPMAACVDRILLWSDNLINDDKLLLDAVPGAVSASMHPAGTAKMGPAADRLAVVDQRLRVHGVDRLRVVDASVMPVIPRAPINLTCIMIAERAAEWIREESGELARTESCPTPEVEV